MLFLIDYENVGNAGMRGCGLLNAWDHVIIFYSDASKNMEREYLEKISASGCALEVCKLCKAGKNALDFYIASKLGEMIGSGYEGNVVIVSRDSGFQAVQDYWSVRALHKRRVLRRPSVEDGIISGGENSVLIRELKRKRENLAIGDYYSAYQKREKVREILQKLFAGTEYENRVDEIFCLVEDKQDQPRTRYLNSLHLFGRKDGLAIYNRIKSCDKL